MSFFTKFFGVKGSQISQAAADLIVNIDPESASEAEIEVIREDLEEVTTKVVVAESYLEKELEETAAEQTKVDNALLALEILQQDFDAAKGKTKSAIEADMVSLIGELEEAQVELDREKQEDAEAREDLDFWRARQKELADYLKKTKKTSAQLIKTLERQEASTKRAKEREKFGEAGKVESTATSAMERRLAELKAQEKVSVQMTTLTSDTSVTQTSDRVKDALARAKGEVDTSKMTPQERIAAFKAKHK